MEQFTEKELKKIFQRGIINTGDISNVSRVFWRALAGEEITVSFIGGSITQGCLCSYEEGQYTRRVYSWFCEGFPSSHVKYLNAPVGGTDSQFGVARVSDDILSKQPDIVFVEFSVNDKNEPLYMETYEGLIRRILMQPDAPAIFLVMNCMYLNGESAIDMHLPVAKKYGLPAVCMRESIYREIQDGRITSEDISSDGLHPNDYGHELLAGQIIYYLEKIKSKCQLPAPITENRFERSKLYNNRNCLPALSGFSADKMSVRSSYYYFSDGWTAKDKGACISFKACGRIIAVQYRKSAKHPAPIARAYIDGDLENAVLLDANFDQDWGDCLFLQTLSDNLSDKLHTVTIEIIEAHENDTAEFYLVSLICA